MRPSTKGRRSRRACSTANGDEGFQARAVCARTIQQRQVQERTHGRDVYSLRKALPRSIVISQAASDGRIHDPNGCGVACLVWSAYQIPHRLLHRLSCAGGVLKLSQHFAVQMVPPQRATWSRVMPTLEPLQARSPAPHPSPTRRPAAAAKPQQHAGSRTRGMGESRPAHRITSPWPSRAPQARAPRRSWAWMMAPRASELAPRGTQLLHQPLTTRPRQPT